MDWVWDATNQVYYSASSGTYAVMGASGWEYVARADMQATDDKEEGEIQDDVGWGALMEDKPKVVGRILRLVVSKSDVLDNGVVIIDGREGGVQIGRDRDKGGSARLRLKEMEVSKTHAVVYWSADESKWCIVDLGASSVRRAMICILADGTGSTHGTWVNGKRLSEAKHSSQPTTLVHLSKIAIGTTTLVAHAHDSWPCDDCALGIGEIKLDTGPATADKQVEKHVWDGAHPKTRAVRAGEAMANLRQQIMSAQPDPRGTPDRAYVDRSAMRRAMQRRSASPQRDEALGPTPPAFGAALLAAQGWTPGTGLGKDQSGRSEPIQVEQRDGRRGLGTDADWKARGKQRRYDDYAR